MRERYTTITCQGKNKKSKPTQHRGRAIVRNGLALHKVGFKGPYWAITHVASGKVINTEPIRRCDLAREIFIKLLDEGIPWEKPIGEFTTRDKELISLAARVYGLR
jgi:hypothetical protein